MTETIIEAPFGINEIKRILPHRYPLLLVDKVTDYTLEPEKTLTAIKNVTANEPFFEGHFPSNPVMPGSPCRTSSTGVSLPVAGSRRKTTTAASVPATA